MIPSWGPNPVAVDLLPPLVCAWFPGRVWSCARPIPGGLRVALVSSRLPRRIDPRGAWLCSLRQLLERVRRTNDVVIAGRGSAGSELVLRGAVRAGIRCVAIHCPTAAEHKARPRRGSQAAELSEPAEPPELLLEPATPGSCDAPGSTARGVPDRDRAAVAWADRVIALAVRTGGNLYAVLRERLAYGDRYVFLADLPGRQARRARDELLGLGAELLPIDAGSVNVTPAGADSAPGAYERPNRSFKPPSSSPPSYAADEWLTHTTRACTGPWPGQSTSDYLDSLLDARTDADHSAFMALSRIIRERRLIASSRAIRGGHRVVSFTAVPPPELPRLRVFRVHRGRWDFEPYGICLRRGWLEQRGARPVVYADDSAWESLGAADRPFFQSMRSSARGGRRGRWSAIDWSVEQEWRHVGDVDLSALRSGDAMVFVAAAREAGTMLEFCPWPVTVLDGSNR